MFYIQRKSLTRRMKMGSQYCFTYKRFILVHQFLILDKTSNVYFYTNSSFTELILHEIDEWTNFLDRLNDPMLLEKDKSEFLREWVSYRGQTLARTGTKDQNVNHIVLVLLWLYAYINPCLFDHFCQLGVWCTIGRLWSFNATRKLQGKTVCGLLI